jgi:iron complex outermembrane recepter protein
MFPANAQVPYFSPPSVDLKSLSLEQLGNIEITTQSKEPTQVWNTPSAIYVLTQDDIRRSGATTLPDLLRSVPGVEVAEIEGDQWAVAIRGFNSSFSKDVLLLIDGRSAYTPLFEGVYWDAQDVLLDDVERIEIIRGPGATIWGANAVNGVINIVTKHAKDTQGAQATVTAGYVDRLTGSIREGLHHGPNLQFRLFAKGFVREDEQNVGGDPFDKWHLAHGGLRADWSPNAHDSLTFKADPYTGAAGQQASIATYAPLAQLVVDDTFDVSGGDFVVNWQHSYAGGSDFHAQGYFDRTNRQGIEYGETRSTVDLDFINHLSMLPRQDFVWGAGVRISPSLFIASQPSIDIDPDQQTDSTYSAFLQDTFHLVPNRLNLVLGSKFEHDNYSGFEIEPDGRLFWNVVPHAMLWTSISRAIRSPGRLDRGVDLSAVGMTSPPILIRAVGNPAFKSEIEIGTEVGYRQLLTSRLYADVVAFHNQYDNLESTGQPFASIITSPIAAQVLNVPLVNGIKGTTDGIEIAPDWKPTQRWELKGNFSHVHIDVRPKPGFNDIATVAGDKGSSPHRTATLQSLLDLPHGVEFDFDYRFVSRLPAQNVHSYQTVDMHTSWAPNKSLRLTVAGRNLLQPHHHEFAGDNGNPVGIQRSLYAGITWTR